MDNHKKIWLALICVSLIIIACGRLRGDKGDTGQQGNTGTTGQTGVNGATGSQGQTGATGDTGAVGTPGKPGTEVTGIQFCPGTETTYPSYFPEFGLVIDNEIYGVFSSDGNNWLAKLPPGVYVSTATGLQCTFEILPNGKLR